MDVHKAIARPVKGEAAHFEVAQAPTAKNMRRNGELNPGLPRDRREY